MQISVFLSKVKRIHVFSDLPPKVIPIFKLVLGQSACKALCS